MKIFQRMRPWVFSLALHAAVLAGIGLWAADYYRQQTKSSSSISATLSLAGRVETDAAEGWNYQQDRLAGISDEEKFNELKTKLDALDAIRFRDIRAAADVVERVQGVQKDRWYQPNPDARGTFQPDSATLFDIVRRVKDGNTVYVYTLVDAAGRTITAEVPEDRMTPADQRVFEIFDLARRNPKLRYLLEAALRIGENQLRKEADSRPRDK